MKKRIYKITAILLTMALFLGGCGSAKSSQDSASATTQTTSEKSDDTSKTAEAPEIDGLTYESAMDLTYAHIFWDVEQQAWRNFQLENFLEWRPIC